MRMTVSMRKWTLRNLNLTREVTEARGEDGEATEVVEAGWLITSRIRKNTQSTVSKMCLRSAIKVTQQQLLIF